MRLFLLVNFIIALCFSIAADAIAKEAITISSKVKKAHTQAIIDDLKILDSYDFHQQADPKTLELLELKSLNGKSLSNWLKQRVRYIVDEKALKVWKIVLGKNIFVAEKSYEFEQPNELPDVESIPKEESASEKKGVMVMANVGTMLYYMGKTQEQLLGIKVKKSFFKSHKVPASSPRSGILQIGEGLFSKKLLINKKNPDALSNALFRLATLFHEARHSDGNGKTLGFFHALCPEGHDFAGVHACDRNSNGPYALGSQMIKELSKNCTKCDETEKATLKIFFLDSKNRVLTNEDGSNLEKWDPRPEGKVLPKL